MKLVKDLLYEKENKHLDIARFSALLSVLGYIGVTTVAITQGTMTFDPLQWGSGWAAICGGNAAWIFARQRYEAGIGYNAPSAPTNTYPQSGEYRTPRMYDDDEFRDDPRLF